MSELDKAKVAFDEACQAVSSELELRTVQAQFIGKTGPVQSVMSQLAKLPGQDKKIVGQKANEVKNAIANAVAKRIDALDAAKREAELARTEDATLPGRRHPGGSLHILTQVEREMVGIFAELGFQVAEAGGTLGAVFNAANEVAVDRFLHEQIAYLDIYKTVRDVVDQHDNIAQPSLEQVLEADRWAREQATGARSASDG